ncbi:uncharacterized protein LOC141879799 isoform X2 [Acropora palmata]|uniref:uncharacterized protein LOC141879799 isoform X2 n=1 Tax=Acropora palmata TaxID=6131 RepID=UPI003DA02C43
MQWETAISGSLEEANSQWDLANTYMYFDKFEEAVEPAEKAFEIRKKHLGDHPDTVRSIFQRGVIQAFLEELEKALDLFKKAWKMEKSLQPGNHSVVWKQIIEHVVYFIKDGDQKKKFEKEALAFCQRMWKEEKEISTFSFNESTKEIIDTLMKFLRDGERDESTIYEYEKEELWFYDGFQSSTEQDFWRNFDAETDNSKLNEMICDRVQLIDKILELSKRLDQHEMRTKYQRIKLTIYRKVENLLSSWIVHWEQREGGADVSEMSSLARERTIRDILHLCKQLNKQELYRRFCRRAIIFYEDLLREKVEEMDARMIKKILREIQHLASSVRDYERERHYQDVYQKFLNSGEKPGTLRYQSLDESVSFKPGALSQDDVLGIAHELGSSWKMVGRVLNVPDAVIDQIEANKSEVSEKCYSILRRWQEMYPSDATYHRLARALQDPTVERVDVAVKYCGPQFDKDVAAAEDADSSVPAEIRGRGPEVERAFQKAMKSGKVEVYRGRILLLGQEGAGKTSLKKSLLGLPFDPKEESTVGVEVDWSKCELEGDEVQNWMPSKRKKGEMSELEEELARLIVKDLRETKANDSDSTATDPNAEEVKITDELEERKDYEEPQLWSDEDEPVTDTEEKSTIIEDGQNDVTVTNGVTDLVTNDVTDLVVRYLQSLQLEDDIKSKEVILTLWDFAGQHLYYASHSVFLSGRAVYILVYNLNKNLLATAEPRARQGIIDIPLDNPNDESNLDNLLSWLVSVHCIRSDTNRNVAHKGAEQSYLRPPVIIVGTNSDQPFGDVETTEKHIKKSILNKEYEGHVIAPFFAVNNTTENDEGVQNLRHKVMKVLKHEPYMGEELPLRWFKFEKAVDALVAKQRYFMDLDQLVSVTRQDCQIEDEKEVTAMLNFYHDLGVIVKYGGTVVLQAQWLIDLFKKLITVPPFNEADPLYRKCWVDLEVNGILRIALVDHVFSKFIDQGLRKQDILDLMELHGLIAKFSIATDENQDEQRYFVPTQLRSSPSALCQIKPSKCDPCPLVLHFLDGFVPHGLFPQLVSKFIHWCSENGFKKTPQLFNNGARLFIGKQITFALILICRKRFIKIVLKTRNPCSCKSQSMNASNEMAIKVRNFIERTLDEFSRDLSYLSNLRYELSVVCTHCQQRESDLDGLMSCCHDDDRLHLLQVRPGEELICMENFSDETVKVPGWEMWFEVPHTQTMEPEEDTQIADDPGTVESFDSGTLSEDDVLLITHELGPSWKMVGRVLNVPDAVIAQIEANKSEDSKKCYSILRRWQEMYASDATYHRLARALKHPDVGRVDLAVKYCGLQLGKDVTVVSKTLEDLVNDPSNFLDEICDRLDTLPAGRGNYEHVARHYGYKVFTVQARFKPSPDGPSKALILSIMAGDPDVTVESFAKVVVEQAKREDVAKLLREFDRKR